MAVSSSRSYPGRFTTKGVFRPTFRVPPSYKPPPGLVPAALPETPLNLSVVAGSGQVTLTWDESYSTRRLIDYLVEYTVYGSGTWTAFTHTASVANTITVTGLTNGVDYQFRVSAVSIYGTSAPTGAIAATPDTSIGYWGIYGSNPGISPDSIRFTGGTISIVGSYVYHVFTASSTLGWIGGDPVTGVELQICGGGGTGGNGASGKTGLGAGGGGAGGWQEVTGLTFSNSATIVVGGTGSQSYVGTGVTNYIAESGKTGGDATTRTATAGQFGSGAGANTGFTGTTAGGATTGGGYRGGNSFWNGTTGGPGTGAGHGAAGTDAIASANALPATIGATRWLGIETGYGGGCGNSLGPTQQISSTYSNPAYGSGGCGGAVVSGSQSGIAGKAGIVIVRYQA